MSKDNVDLAEEKIKEALTLIVDYCACKDCMKEECKGYKVQKYLRKSLKLFPKEKK